MRPATTEPAGCDRPVEPGDDGGRVRENGRSRRGRVCLGRPDARPAERAADPDRTTFRWSTRAQSSGGRHTGSSAAALAAASEIPAAFHRAPQSLERRLYRLRNTNREHATLGVLPLAVAVLEFRIRRRTGADQPIHRCRQRRSFERHVRNRYRPTVSGNSRWYRNVDDRHMDGLRAVPRLDPHDDHLCRRERRGPDRPHLAGREASRRRINRSGTADGRQKCRHHQR